MHIWKSLTDNSIALQGIFAGVGALLTVVTIGVLVATLRAIKRQAKASELLIKATEQQTAATKAQAQAAAEQVELARRQITESLRPMLLAHVDFRSDRSNGKSIRSLIVKNEGAGTALDVWWTYGQPHLHPEAGHHNGRVEPKILAPGKEGTFEVEDKQAFAYGVMILYRSLSGILSATEIERESVESKNVYHPDAEKDFPGLSKVSLPESTSQPV